MVPVLCRLKRTGTGRVERSQANEPVPTDMEAGGPVRYISAFAAEPPNTLAATWIRRGLAEESVKPGPPSHQTDTGRLSGSIWAQAGREKFPTEPNQSGRAEGSTKTRLCGDLGPSSSHTSAADLARAHRVPGSGPLPVACRRSGLVHAAKHGTRLSAGTKGGRRAGVSGATDLGPACHSSCMTPFYSPIGWSRNSNLAAVA